MRWPAAWGLLLTIAFCASSIAWEGLPEAHYDVIFDREFVHNVPKGPLKGVIFAFPGCDQLPTEWGFSSRHCPLCSGLAEEIAIVSTAVQRGYAVVSVGPHLSGASDRCWTKTWPPEASIEVPELKRAIRHVLEEQKWWGLPRYLLGSSAGGAAALLFATRFPVQAVASLVMGFRPDELFEEKQLVSRNVDQPGGNASWPFPPVFFLAARNDQDIYKERIHRSIHFLKQQGLHAEHVMMEPYALTPTTFSERVPDITSALSSTLYEELQAAGIVNATGFTMYPHDLEDRARQDAMRETLFGILVKHFTSKLGKTGPLHDGYMRVFIEMFYASQANHETRAKEMDSIVDFFEREGVPDAQPITGDMHDLVRQDESAAEVLLRRTGHLPGRICKLARRHVAPV